AGSSVSDDPTQVKIAALRWVGAPLDPAHARIPDIRFANSGMIAPSNPPARMHGGDAAGEVAVAHAAKARLADQGGERLLLRKAADALDEVAVGLGRTRRQGAEPRDHLEGVEVVEAVEQRHLAGRELQAQVAATGPEHAVSLAQGAIDAGNVADAEGDRVGVERLVGERQGLRIADGKGEPSPRGGFR